MIDLEIREISTDADAKLCARLMSDSEPWITLKRDYQKSFHQNNGKIVKQGNN